MQELLGLVALFGAMTAVMVLISAAGEHRLKRRRAGWTAVRFADAFSNLPLDRTQVLAVYRYLQQFYLLKDMPVYPIDSIEDAAGLDEFYGIDEVLEDLLGELGIERSREAIGAVCEREDPRTIADLVNVLATLAAAPGGAISSGPRSRFDQI